MSTVTTARRRFSRSLYERGGKRALDLLGATVLLVLVAPLAAAVAVATWLALGRPVFHREERAGRHGAPFTLRKFRTMTQERDAAGQLLPDERRLTALGRFLRSTSLDELPELLHVIRGDMSLVGPRPLPVKYVDRYTRRQARRLEVLPGLTGLAQTSGRNELSWERRLSLDVQYVEQRCASLDLRLLWRTVRVVLTRRGVSHPGHATMHEFCGTTAAKTR